MTTIPDLSRHDWDALKALARALSVAEAADSPLAGRLVALGVAAASDAGGLRLTEPGRRALVLGSPTLWSLGA